MAPRLSYFALLFLTFVQSSLAESADYIRGYINAVVQYEVPDLRLTTAELLPAGDMTLSVSRCLNSLERQRIEERLYAAKLVRRIKWHSTNDCTERLDVGEVEITNASSERTETLPDREIFTEIVADPRETVSYLGYARYKLGDEWHNFGLINAGDTFPIVNWERPDKSIWQLGIQGGVFALFDVGADSNDLINSDYILGIPLSYREQSFSARARVFHQSSHLGDEFLLNNPEIQRINLSYEELEILASYDIEGFRIFAGPSAIIRSEPDLDPWTIRVGAEYRHPDVIDDFDLLLGGMLASIDQLDWHISQSYRAGLALQRSGNRELQILLQYYSGSSPNGQFFEDEVEYYGIGVLFNS